MMNTPTMGCQSEVEVEEKISATAQNLHHLP